MASRILQYLAGEISAIKQGGSTEITAVKRGTTTIWELSTEIAFSPSWDGVLGGPPLTTQNYTATNGGTFHITGITDGRYVEVDYYINNSYAGFIFIHDGGAMYPNGQTFSMSTNDTIKFRLGGSGVSGSLILKDTDGSGATKLQISFELV